MALAMAEIGVSWPLWISYLKEQAISWTFQNKHDFPQGLS